MPELEKLINKEWLKETGFYDIDTDTDTRISSEVLGKSIKAQKQLNGYKNTGKNPLTHLVVISTYAATMHLPALILVVVDSIPQELHRSNVVLEWFSYVLRANLLLVVPLLWLASYWSLRPIKTRVNQVGELNNGERQQLDENPLSELCRLVRNLNILVRNERQRYTKYHTTLSDVTHSLKTPLEVLQTTLRSLRSSKQTTIEEVEPIMLDQIDRISQQIRYYLHRARINSGQTMLTHEIHSVPALLDSLTVALNKVYQRKAVVIALDISPEVTFMGEKNDFMEVMGNVLENACKYSLEFVEITSLHSDKNLTIVIEDDGLGVPESKRELILSVASVSIRYAPSGISACRWQRRSSSNMTDRSPSATACSVGARMQVTFARQHDFHHKD